MRYACLLVPFLATFVCLTRGYGFGQSCRYWCKTMDHRYYCCPTGKMESWMEYTWHSIVFPWFWTNIGGSCVLPLSHLPWPKIHWRHEKHCPPLRPHCPRTYDWNSPPSFCDRDENCGDWEKCCYDVCLEHKTCKQAQ